MWNYDKEVEFSVLNGQTIKSVEGFEKGSDEIKFITEEGNIYKMYHEQDCCEGVDIEDIEGDLSDLVGGLVVSAEEVKDYDNGHPADYDENYGESYTWTFYKIQTTKGHVWIRWLGESNGYYSEGVNFIWENVPKKEEK